MSRRAVLLSLWITVVALATYGYFGERDLLQRLALEFADAPPLRASVVYLFVGCVRGFTLVRRELPIVIAWSFFPIAPPTSSATYAGR